MTLRDALKRFRCAEVALEEQHAKHRELIARGDAVQAELEAKEDAASAASAKLELGECSKDDLAAAEKALVDARREERGIEAAIKVVEKRIRQAERNRDAAEQDALRAAAALARVAAQLALVRAQKAAESF